MIISPLTSWMILHILFCLKVNMAEMPPKKTSWTDTQIITGVITMLFFCCPLPSCYWKWNLDLLCFALPSTSSFAPKSLSEQTQHTIGELWPFSGRGPQKSILACHMCCKLEVSDCWIKQEIWKQIRWYIIIRESFLVFSTVINGGSLLNVNICMLDACFTVH